MPADMRDMLTLEEMLGQIGAVGGFAIGKYCCECCKCKRTFLGDKRAIQCLPCAIDRLSQNYKPIEAAKSIVEKLERHEKRLIARYSMLGNDEEEFPITAGEARALRAALSDGH